MYGTAHFCEHMITKVRSLPVLLRSLVDLFLGNTTISCGERFCVRKYLPVIECTACRTPPAVREIKWGTPQCRNFTKSYPLLVFNRSICFTRSNPSTGSLLRVSLVHPKCRGEGDQRRRLREQEKFAGRFTQDSPGRTKLVRTRASVAGI